MNIDYASEQCISLIITYSVTGNSENARLQALDRKQCVADS